MKKYFVTSDTHGFTTLLKESLENKGFDIDNPDHILIICGDLFDRGLEAVAMYDFVKNLGDRFIYIRGNHEDLLDECVHEMETGFSISTHHKANGTVTTVNQFLENIYGENYKKLKYDAFDKYIKSDYEDRSALDEYFKPIHEILNWINNKSVNYFELDNYIFVHGWIPKTPADNIVYRWNGVAREGGTFNPDWRNAREFDWKEARWLNGMEEWKWYNIKEPNKIIVCGHWHCSYGWSYIKQQRKEFPPKNRKGWEKSFEPFEGKGIIAIDACTAYSGLVNILVIEK